MKFKKLLSLLLVGIMTFSVLTGCGSTDATSDTSSEASLSASEEVVEEDLYVAVDWDDASVLIFEAEDGTLIGNAAVGEDSDGTVYVDGFEKSGDGVEITVTVEETGFYDINVISASQTGDYKANYLYVDGDQLGTVEVEGKEYADSVYERVYLEAGSHTVEIQEYWGWIKVDCVKLRTSSDLSSSRFNIEPTLVNENATDSAKRLMTYLCDIYGEYILSGQYCDTGAYGKENAVIYKETGEYPAILGLDMIEYSPSRVANGSTSNATDYAIAYWEMGGIVTFCWHWNAPEKYLTGNWYSGFYVEYTNIDLAKIMNGEDEEGYELLMEDIDAIAQQLLILQENDVPILWRPLHEASGGWFWWGASGAEAYKQLYILLYEKLTYEYGLNNLIWVWNGQDADWYPGDEYVDIIGEDIYAGEQEYSSQIGKYLEILNYSGGNKMIILSENGTMIDPDLSVRDGALWGSFCVWSGEFVAKSSAIYTYNDTYTDKEMLAKVYTSDTVITRSELPDLKTYPLGDEE